MIKQANNKSSPLPQSMSIEPAAVALRRPPPRPPKPRPLDDGAAPELASESEYIFL